PPQIAALARFGAVAAVQPAFDAYWGGEHGMYATRLGGERAAAMNPFAALAAGGVRLALSSDAPVTPLDPWGAIRAATGHHTPAARLTPAAAFDAATRGGWRAARARTDGTLAAGNPATFAVWQVPTGPAGEPARLLPDLAGPDPTCLRTVLTGT